MNALEKLQQETNGMISIKSYPILNHFQPSVKSLFELILSYQFDNKTLSMTYTNISILTGVKIQTIKNIVHKYKKIGVIVPDNKSNHIGDNWNGSHTKLVIDINLLISTLTDTPTTATPSVEPEQVSTEIDLDNLTDDEIMALATAELKQAGDKPIDIKKQMVQMVEQSLNLNTYERQDLISDIYGNKITTVDHLTHQINVLASAVISYDN
jgi:hypothetical protein